MSEWLALALILSLFALLAWMARPARIVPAEFDIEAPDMAKNIAEARVALDRFTDRHDLRELKEIGHDIGGIVEAARRAEVQIAQAEAAPTREKETREALAAFERLRERVAQCNKRIAQMRDGSWPE